MAGPLQSVSRRTDSDPGRILLLLTGAVVLLGALASILKTIVLTGKALLERARGSASD